ncbi:STAS domain-containing protein [Bosea sp. 124]|nr:STAS domain-containing protein [Bosea sp. 124]PTM39670.1 STAS domain-containing protein [Bosea sp. 124]
MSNESAEIVPKFDPGSDCTIRNSRSLAASLVGLVNSGSGVEIDCAAVEQADITFVQTIVSAERSFGARNLPFIMLAATESVRSAFGRAGVSLPGASPSEPSGN